MQTHACITVATVTADRMGSISKCANARNVNFNPNNQKTNVNNDNPNNENDNLGAVRLLRDYWLCEAFNQPPSIRPISSALAWSWKTFVSFESFSSRSSRIFIVRTSCNPLALIRYAVFIVFGAFLAITRCSRRDKMLCSMLWPSMKRQRFAIWSFIWVKSL